MASPHESARTAHTSSNEQVRKPIYTSSVGRWQLYAAAEDNSSDSHEDSDGLATGSATPAAAAAAAAATSQDLEELARRSGAFPAAALLERVLSFEPSGSREEARLDLARFLPCESRRSSNEGGTEVRWPDSGGIARI
jgi:hypothetical protein